MTFKYGISIYSIPNHSIDVLFDFVEENNIDAIELWDSSLTSNGYKIYRYLAKKDRELSIHAPLLNLGDIKVLDNNIQILNQTLERARIYGAKTVVLHTGILNEIDIFKGIEVAKKVIDTNLELLEQNNIVLCIENVGFLGNDLISNFDQLVAFVDYFPKHLVGTVFDIAHANVKGEVKLGLKTLGNRIKHIHLGDNSGEINDHHMAIGKGNIDFSILKKSTFPDNLTAIIEITPSLNWQKDLLDSRKILDKLNHIE